MKDPASGSDKRIGETLSHATALKRLRSKFIALNMGTVVVILVVVIVGICMVDWQRSVAEVDESLHLMVKAAAHQEQNGTQFAPRIGAVPDAEGDTVRSSTTVAVYELNSDGTGELKTSLSSASIDDSTLESALSQINEEYADAIQAATPNNPAETDALGAGAESALDAGAAAADANATNQSTAESSEDPRAQATTAADPGAQAAASSDAGAQDATAQTPADIQAKQSLQNQPVDYLGRGTLWGLHYVIGTCAGHTFVAFADETATSSWQSLALTLGLACAGALVVFFIINLLFSRWALRPVEAAWQRQRAFVADASHELKTPLTVIMADLDIAREQRDSTIAEQDRWLGSARLEADRMQGLVQDMLELARLDEDERLRDAERVNLSDLVEGELLEYESLFFERGVQLDTDVEPNVAINGSAQRLKRLIGTLADNAGKYAGAQGRVNVTLTHAAGKALLSFNNTGEPIAAEDLPHVFDRFYRANKARTRDGQPGGTGLGLAIAHEIVNEHGGSLSVTSSAQAGTTFTASLPLAK